LLEGNIEELESLKEPYEFDSKLLSERKGKSAPMGTVVGGLGRQGLIPSPMSIIITSAAANMANDLTTLKNQLGDLDDAHAQIMRQLLLSRGGGRTDVIGLAMALRATRLGLDLKLGIFLNPYFNSCLIFYSYSYSDHQFNHYLTPYFNSYLNYWRVDFMILTYALNLSLKAPTCCSFFRHFEATARGRDLTALGSSLLSGR
jgi:hypothetical protein